MFGTFLSDSRVLVLTGTLLPSQMGRLRHRAVKYVSKASQLVPSRPRG